MIEVRILGVLLSLPFVVAALRGLGRPGSRLLLLRDVATLAVGIGLVSLGLFPRWFDWAARIIGVDSLQGRRLTLLTVLSLGLLAAGLFTVIGRIGALQAQLGELTSRLAIQNPRLKQSFPLPATFVAVVIPAFNEQASIAWVLDRVPRRVHGLDTVRIVVSDGSTDSTPALAAETAEVVLERSLRRGSGASVRTGLQFAFQHGAIAAVMLDADGQHDPEEIPNVVGPVLLGDADMVQGSRIENSHTVSGSRWRAIGVRIFARILQRLLNVPLTDPSNGFRAISRQAYQCLHLQEEQFYVGEFIVQCGRRGLAIREVPINVMPRRHGLSKKPGALNYGWGFARSIVRGLFSTSRQSP